MNWWRNLPEPDKGILGVAVVLLVIATIILTVALLGLPGDHLGL